MTYLVRGATRRASVACLLLWGALTAAPTAAQSPSDQWQFTAVIYGYFPKISGSTTFPTGASASIGVTPNDYIGNLKFAFMGALEARQGALDLFTDVLYMDASGSKSQSRNLSVGGISLPVGVSVDANLKVVSTLWTLAGGYRFVDTPEWSLDVFGGARNLNMKQTLGYTFSADIGPFTGPLRQGSSSVDVNNWDAILGAKGRYMFGEKHDWFVPYYLDVGTGQSQYTWQTYAGVGYRYDWGELIGVWRYIDYKLSSSAGTSLTLNGPAVGVAFHW